MPDSAIATAADYADAMLTARRAKNWLFLILLVLLLLQVGIFFMYHYDVIRLTAPVARRVVTTASTHSAASIAEQDTIARLLLTYLVGLTDFLGITLMIVLALVLLLIVNIMLVGRLIGVARVTSAYVWSLVLLVLLFPWQAFLGSYAFKIPGVLYTWDDLVALGRWDMLTWQESFLKWSRFAGFPIIAIILLMRVQVKSSRGIRQALGEATDVAA